METWETSQKINKPSPPPSTSSFEKHLQRDQVEGLVYEPSLELAAPRRFGSVTIVVNCEPHKPIKQLFNYFCCPSLRNDFHNFSFFALLGIRLDKLVERKQMARPLGRFINDCLMEIPLFGLSRRLPLPLAIVDCNGRKLRIFNFPPKHFSSA